MNVLVQYSISHLYFFKAVCGGKFATILFHQINQYMLVPLTKSGEIDEGASPKINSNNNNKQMSSLIKKHLPFSKYKICLQNLISKEKPPFRLNCFNNKQLKHLKSSVEM